jgi:hypothetical protein
MAARVKEVFDEVRNIWRDCSCKRQYQRMPHQASRAFALVASRHSACQESPMLFELPLLDDSLFQSLIVTEPATLHSFPTDNIKRRHQAPEQYHRPNNFITPILFSIPPRP